MTEAETLLLVTSVALAQMLKENPHHRHADTIDALLGLNHAHLAQTKGKTANDL